MYSLNSVMLIGRLSADPVIRISKAGKPWATCSLAVHRAKKNASPGTERSGVLTSSASVASSTVQRVQFYPLLLFGKWATQKELKKGRPVFIAGRISNRSYATSNGGMNYEIIVERLSLLDAVV